MNKVIDTMNKIRDNEHILRYTTKVRDMNTHRDCYLDTVSCNDLDALRDEFSYWSNVNTDKVIVSHSVSVCGMTYLLSISYYYLDDE